MEGWGRVFRDLALPLFIPYLLNLTIITKSSQKLDMVTYSISSVHLGDKTNKCHGSEALLGGLRNPNISIKIMYPAPEKVTNSASQPRYHVLSLHPNNFSWRQNMPALRKSLFLLSHCFSSDSNFLENGALTPLTVFFGSCHIKLSVLGDKIIFSRSRYL